MTHSWIYLVIPALVVVRILARRRRATDRKRQASGLPAVLTSPVALVAAREIRERFRGRIFKVGTVLILAVVAAAIVIPTLGSKGTSTEPVGVLGRPTPIERASVDGAASSAGAAARIVSEPSLEATKQALRAGRIDLALIGPDEILVASSISSSDTSTTAQVVDTLAETLGVARAESDAGITAAQARALEAAKSIPVVALTASSASNKPAQSTSVIGSILVFIMLSQYLSWILVGVMEEKSSRVVEVLLATVSPMRLLAGKVLGIGAVALSQAAVIVGFALVLSKAVGSDDLKGTGPVLLLSTLVWLLLGYAFYSWVYAAAGSLAERQAQVQSLAFPLSLPIVFAYVMALTTAASGSASTLFRVLCYLPPTAPLTMPVLVGLSAATWWQFLLSCATSILATFAVATIAAGVYRRSILQTGKRVSLRSAFGRVPTSA